MLSVAFEQIVTKLREDKPFQDGFDSLIRLAQTPFVRSIVGDEIDMDQIEATIQRIRTDPVIYDVITTIKNILECFSVDRFEAYDTETELRRKAFDLNQKRMFYAAIYFNETETENVSYKFHMDTQNTQPTIENKNRFWFPGPSGSMLMDLKYHRGFVQIKQSLDLGIIKHKKEKLKKQGLIAEVPVSTTPRNSFSIKVVTDGDDDIAEDGEEENDDDWFTDSNTTDISNSSSASSSLISSFISGGITDFKNTAKIPYQANVDTEDVFNDSSTTSPQEYVKPSTLYPDLVDSSEEDDSNLGVLKRQKRQNFFDFLLDFNDDSGGPLKYDVDELEFHTKQFPYPQYTEDE